MSGDKVWIAEKADAFSGATPLGDALVGNFDNFPSATDMFLGFIPGSVGETSTLAILIGAVILLFTGIASWRVMFSVFAGGYIMGLIFNFFGANAYMELPAYYHLVMGGFAFGAVFMATDPVTAAQTNRGKYIYGFLIGFMAVIIRVVNPAYPEGMMLAILLLNVFAPLIDHYVVESNIKRRLKRIKVKA
jgi:Na+-transporting NADH:ubiquinone oxidoreductase subunit B